MRELERQRAENALRRVEELIKDNDDFRKSYRAYVERLGPAVLMNGLGQALASELAAAGVEPKEPKERAHRELYENVQRWLCREGGVYAEETDVLAAIVVKGEADYLRAQAETLAWLEWHKKFCRAHLPRGEEE